MTCESKLDQKPALPPTECLFYGTVTLSRDDFGNRFGCTTAGVGAVDRRSQGLLFALMERFPRQWSRRYWTYCIIQPE